jgi:hypothetical protein
LIYVFALVARDALAHALGRGATAHHPRMFRALVGALLMFAGGITWDDPGRRPGLSPLRKGHGKRENDSREHEAICMALHRELLGSRELTLHRPRLSKTGTDLGAATNRIDCSKDGAQGRQLN